MYAGQPVRAVDDGKKTQHDNKREVGCDKAHMWLCLLSYKKLKFFKSVYKKICCGHDPWQTKKEQQFQFPFSLTADTHAACA